MNPIRTEHLGKPPVRPLWQECETSLLQDLVDILRKHRDSKCTACKGSGRGKLRGYCEHCRGRGNLFAPDPD